MMQENVTLVKEINDLRREIKQMKMAQQAAAMAGTGSVAGRKGGGAGDMGGGGEAARLRQRIDELEAGATIAQRPASRERAVEMPNTTM